MRMGQGVRTGLGTGASHVSYRHNFLVLVTSVSVQVNTLTVFSIRYVCYAGFSSLSMYFPFVTFVTLISA